MIIVRLKGGLGNQLSQYALGRKIAYLHNTELKLDTTWFTTISSDTPRTYRLNNYNIIGTIASAEEIQLIERGRAQGRGYLLSKISDWLTPMYRRTYVRERMHTFDKAILTVPDNVYLDGYWQTEKYYKDIKEILHKEITLREEPDTVNWEMAELIRSGSAVSIHVRRGDYVSNPTTQQFHGCCSLDYYNRAISLIEQKVDDPSFFIFSDDLPWAKKNLEIPGEKTFVAHNGPEKEYCDLWLMSLCQHHIIANSSFSWWGAWLSQDAEKMVIAPRRWALSESFDTSDIIPDSWITI
jgi:hypothetical protein